MQMRKPVIRSIKDERKEAQSAIQSSCSLALPDRMDTTNSDPLILPNPYTPLAWFPSETAQQFENGRYIVVASVGASALIRESFFTLT